MSRVISTKVNEETDRMLGKIAEDLHVSKSWLLQQALKQYLERYENYLSDIRIASMGTTVSHEDVLKEYGLQH